MKLALIVPFKNLDLMNISDYDYILTREAKMNKQYKDFYTKSERYSILDNNVHERSEINWEDHVELAINMGVNEIVVPDVMKDKERTLRYFNEFMNMFYEKLKEHNIIIQAVPQGETWEEIQECFDVFNKDTRVKIIGNSFDLIPFQICDKKYENQSFNRTLIINSWIRKSNKPIHLLGSNGTGELITLSKFSLIRSTDGKLFSRIGLANMDLEKEMDVYKPNIKMYFDDDIENKNLFIRNVNYFKQIIN